MILNAMQSHAPSFPVDNFFPALFDNANAISKIREQFGGQFVVCEFVYP